MLMSVRFLYRALSDYVRWAYFEYKVLMFLFLYTLKIDFDTGQDRSYCLSVCPSVNFFVLFLIVSNQSNVLMSAAMSLSYIPTYCRRHEDF